MPDQIRSSVTHEVLIDGEKSWIGLEYSAEVEPGETPEEARKRVHSVVNHGVLESIQETVETVRKATS